MLEAFELVGRIGRQARAQARHVQLGGGEQGAQLVVQLARQVGALFLDRLLQVGGQLREPRRAFAHLRFQGIALGLQRAVLVFLGALQLARLAAVEHQREQRREDAGGHAHPGDRHQAADVFAPIGDLPVDLAQQRLCQSVGLSHLVEPDIGGDDEIDRFHLAFLAQADGQIHFAEFLHHGLGKGAGQLPGLGTLHIGRLDEFQFLVDELAGTLVGLQVGLVARHDEAALGGFGDGQFTQGVVQRGAHGVGAANVGQCCYQARERAFVEHQHHGRAGEGDDQREPPVLARALPKRVSRAACQRYWRHEDCP